MEFTVKIEGLDLPKEASLELSKELNRFAIKKIAELDFSKGLDIPRSVWVIKDLVNGGITHLLSKSLQSEIIKEAPHLKGSFSVVNAI